MSLVLRCVGSRLTIYCAQAAVAEVGVAQSFGVSTEVATLSLTLFVLGIGTGPLLVGPLAALWGQQAIYLGSFTLMFAFTFPVAFSHHIGVSQSCQPPASMSI